MDNTIILGAMSVTLQDGSVVSVRRYSDGIIKLAYERENREEPFHNQLYISKEAAEATAELLTGIIFICPEPELQARVEAAKTKEKQ